MGSRRTCLVDACLSALNFDTASNLRAVRDLRAQAPQTDTFGDPSIIDINNTFLIPLFQHKLVHITSKFMGTGGLYYNLINAQPLKYILRLRITYNNKINDTPDWHFAYYNGLQLINNEGQRVLIAEDKDKINNTSSMKYFSALYPSLKVVITQVYQLVSL